MPQKRRRTSPLEQPSLADILHVGGASVIGLARLITSIRASDCSESTMRKHMMDANRADFERIAHTIELPLLEGGTWLWTFIDPSHLLVSLVNASPSLGQLYANAWRRSPPSPQRPWSLIVAFDEFTPGNKLQTDQTRKTMVLSFSFLQLGQAALSFGSSWATAVCVRSNKLKEASLVQACCGQSRTGRQRHIRMCCDPH